MIETLVTFFQTPIGTFVLGYITSTVVSGIGEHYRLTALYKKIGLLYEK